MPNRVIIKNNLDRLNDKELEEKLKSEANKKMLWNFQKDRTKKEPMEKPEEKPKE